MLERFPARWTPIERASSVRRGRVSKVRVAGVDLAIFRGEDGRLGALLDRCPHRGVALSLGRVEGDTLECPFHGWRFDADGRCAHVPLCAAGETKRASLGATALPVREIAGLVWVHTAPHAEHEPAVPDALVAPDWARTVHVETWATHWTRAMENMLDFPHVGWVHRGTIGRGVRARAERGGAMALRVEPTREGMRIHASIDGDDLGMAIEWWSPNAMVQHLSTRPGRRITQVVYCVPVDDTHTRMIVVSARDWGRWSPLGWVLDAVNRRVLTEDRAIVESSSPPEVPPASAERSVATDAPTLAFRRFYHRELLGSRAIPPVALVRRPAPVGELDPGADAPRHERAG